MPVRLISKGLEFRQVSQRAIDWRLKVSIPDYDPQLIDTDYWKVVDTDGKTPEIVFEEVKDMVKNAVDGTLKKDSELKPL